jgi:hypothetical protein
VFRDANRSPSYSKLAILNGLDGKPLSAADIDDGEAMRGAKFPQHPMNVVANGLFGKLESVGDLLISEALRD